jgi:hypothetical protein
MEINTVAPLSRCAVAPLSHLLIYEELISTLSISEGLHPHVLWPESGS